MTSPILFQVFSMRETVKATRPELSLWFDRPTGRQVVFDSEKYPTHSHLYHAAASFATSVGERLVAITGSPMAEYCGSYSAGEVVVWYRAEDNKK